MSHMISQSTSWHGKVVEVHQWVNKSTAPRDPDTVRRRLLVEVKGGASVSLASPDRPYHRYCVRPNGQLTVHEGVSKGSVFIVETIETAEMFTGRLHRFRSAVSVPKARDSVGEVAYYLSIHADGALSCARDSTAAQNCDPSTLLCAAEQTTTTDAPQAMSDALTRWQKSRFVTEGYLIVENVVGGEELEQCQRLLMHNLGIPGAVHAGL